MLPPDKFPLVLYPVWGPQWGFVGYLLAWVLGALKWSPAVWDIFRNVFFWLHFVIVTALLYYLPFSRFFHVIMSPVIVAYNTMLEQEAHPVQRRRGGEKRQPAT
jgi:nitrate reductase gamma subunit